MLSLDSPTIHSIYSARTFFWLDRTACISRWLTRNRIDPPTKDNVKFDKIAKIKSQCRHLGSFSNDSCKDLSFVMVLPLLSWINVGQKTGTSRHIICLERARELINSTLNDPFDALVPHSKSGIEKRLSARTFKSSVCPRLVQISQCFKGKWSKCKDLCWGVV